MNLRQRLFQWLRGPEPVAQSPEEKPMKISKGALLTSQTIQTREVKTFEVYKPAPGVVPKESMLAMDSAMTDNYQYAIQGAYQEGLGFMGYAYLAELTQRAEYRRPSEIIAEEMTRKWLKIQSTGDEEIGDKTDKIKAIEAEFERLKVRDVFKRAAEHDGFFGRGQIYIDTGATDQPDELDKPLSVSAGKIGKGMLKGLQVVEPMWTYPNMYNSLDPLKEDYFKPQEWFVMGKRVNASRLMFFVSRPVPDLLKPVYAFGGLSLSQMAKPYVDNWLRTRQSVSDLLHSFSVFVLKTNMSGMLNQGSGDAELARAQFFNQVRDNRGLMMIDKDTEDFTNVSTSLGSLDHLQAQAQEHMSAVTGIPLIKLFGISPSGLNASSEGELRVFYDTIEASQQKNFTPHIERLLKIVQLSLFGEIDPEIGFAWEPLWGLDKTELATVQKTECDTDVAYINAGVLSPEEVRSKLASEEDSPYASLDVDDVPEAPQVEEEPENAETAGAE